MPMTPTGPRTKRGRTVALVLASIVFIGAAVAAVALGIPRLRERSANAAVCRVIQRSVDEVRDSPEPATENRMLAAITSEQGRASDDLVDLARAYVHDVFFRWHNKVYREGVLSTTRLVAMDEGEEAKGVRARLGQRCAGTGVSIRFGTPP